MTGLGFAGALLLAVVLWPSHAGAQGVDACAACHLETGDERLAAPARNFNADIHKAKGFGCVDCHGGDSRATGMEAMDPRKGFIGKPSRPQVVQVCGRCHSDACLLYTSPSPRDRG